jgi:hypothetical protein
MRNCLWTCAFFFAATLSFATTSKDVPSWVQEVSSRNLPAYNGKVPAAVLLEEQRVSVDGLGLVTTKERKAIKIFTHEGKREAEATVAYSRGGRRVKSLRAWLIAPNGFVKTFEKNSIADMGAFEQMELYNDIRFEQIKAENPELGAVFAYEVEVEERTLFAQDEYAFQGRLPAVESRYVLTVPGGWSVKSALFNHSPLEPVVDGTTYTWKLSDLPFHEREAHSPSVYGMVPRLAVDFLPPPNAPNVTSTCFRSWTDVSRWHTNLSAGQDEVTPDLTAKSRELTANAKTEYDRIQAISRYVQKIKYVAIEMDLAHGGGYKPHAASLVLRKQYGDCKDKANLMRSLLKAAGLESYLVAIYSGDRNYVRQEWPSPSQFNHMIIAVRVSDGITAPTVIQVPSLGRVLIFDPTSETTPLGDLPWYEQDSFAALMAGDKGTILKMPLTKPEANSTDIDITAELTNSGALKALCRFAESGQSADKGRAQKLYQSPDEYRRSVEGFFSQRIKGATISQLNSDDQFNENRFLLSVELGSSLYGQLMQRRLLVFNPGIIEPAHPLFPVNETRAEPIVLRAEAYRKHVRIKLPDGFTIDEVPTPVRQQSPWGQFSLTFEQKPGELVVEEELKTEAVTLPSGQYREVKKFFDHFSGADQQQAVLVKN